VDQSFELIGKFNSESRQAFFSATMDALAAKDSSRLGQHMVASLLRAPSLGTLVQQQRVDLGALFAELKSDPPGEAVFDAFRQLIAKTNATGDESSDDGFEAVRDKPPLNRMPPVGMFGSVAMSPSVAAAWKQMAEEYASAPEESVTPAEILLCIVQNEPSIQTILETHAFGIAQLRKFIGERGAV
jgi:hypothetical protein